MLDGECKHCSGKQCQIYRVRMISVNVARLNKQYKLHVFTEYMGRERENPWSGQQELCTDQTEL